MPTLETLDKKNRKDIRLWKSLKYRLGPSHPAYNDVCHQLNACYAMKEMLYLDLVKRLYIN
jgi:hypothetical protein